jgi:hypothetical protein
VRFVEPGANSPGRDSAGSSERDTRPRCRHLVCAAHTPAAVRRARARVCWVCAHRVCCAAQPARAPAGRARHRIGGSLTSRGAFTDGGGRAAPCGRVRRGPPARGRGELDAGDEPTPASRRPQGSSARVTSRRPHARDDRAAGRAARRRGAQGRRGLGGAARRPAAGPGASRRRPAPPDLSGGSCGRGIDRPRRAQPACSPGCGPASMPTPTSWSARCVYAWPRTGD